MRAALDQAGEIGELTGLEKGAEDLPVDSVPADYQNSFGHVVEVNSASRRRKCLVEAAFYEGSSKSPRACARR